ncbi:23S rRNA (uracil(1939)-C(5))-methyltransferase RlmD, partial [Huaxiibacter chinensis]
GFRQAGSNEIVDIRQCPVLVPQLEALLPDIRNLLTDLQSVRSLGHIELVLADNGPVMVLRHTSPLSAQDGEKLERFSHLHHLSLFLAPQSEILHQITGEAPWYSSDGLRLSFSPRDFIQVNDGVNQQMVARALTWLDIQPE